MPFEKIFSAEQMRSADAYTIEHEPVSSINLMERASGACNEWILANLPDTRNVTIVCGTGNNGGDGLAVARMLNGKKNVTAIVLKISDKPTPDFKLNRERLKVCPGIRIVELEKGSLIAIPEDTDLLIDAVFGTGLSRAPEGWLKHVIETMNSASATKLAIDMPSGLFCDRSSKGNAVFQADITLTFELAKLALLLPENGKHVGNFHILPIGLHRNYINETHTPFYYVDKMEGNDVLPCRAKFSHKGSFGHVLIIAGSYGKTGAAMLASKACLRTGAGLVTNHLPQKCVDCMQASFPEAMVSIDGNSHCFSSLPQDLDKYTVAAIGPGLGTSAETQNALRKFLSIWGKAAVLDADALNCISLNDNILSVIPENSILTPHPKEFERLAGTWGNDFERLEKQCRFSKLHNVIVVLKGAHTSISVPRRNGEVDVFFNSTGNPGMATAGSGDVLTGIIAGLLAQGVSPEKAAILGAYLHGEAGDKARNDKGDSLIASDIIENLTIGKTNTTP